MIGPADLSISLGIPGQFDNPLLIETVDKVIETCNRHGVVPGIQTRGVAMAKFWAERGMRFVGVAAEHVFLLEKCKEAMATLRPAKAAVNGTFSAGLQHLLDARAALERSAVDRIRREPEAGRDFSAGFASTRASTIRRTGRK